MSLEGRIENGYVVFEDPVPLPEGTPVRVEPLSTGRAGIAAAGIDHLSDVMRELVNLWTGPATDDYGVLRPSPQAFEAASRLLVDTAIVAHRENRRIPLGCVSTDSEGGVRLEWVREMASIHLVIAADASAYIYLEVGTDFATEDAKPERLAHWLREIG